MTRPDTSLENLRDIVVPEPPPLWPPAPGVWVLLIVVLAVVLALFLLWRRARAKNAYRRAGLTLLHDARTVREVNVILKRVALAAFPRHRVASLYGEEWAAFLDETCRGSHFSSLGGFDPVAEAPPELQSSARTWIRRHQSESTGTVGGAA